MWKLLVMPKKKTGMLWRLLILSASETLPRTGTRTSNRVLRQKISYRKNINSIFFFLSLVAGYSLNIGCADVVKIEKNYGLISRYEYLTRVSKGAKNTFLKEFEHWEDDENEILETDIKKCWRLEGENPVAPKTSQGRIAKSLLNKQKNTYLFSLFGGLSSFQCLLIPGIEVGTLSKQSLAKNRVLRKPESCEIDILN